MPDAAAAPAPATTPAAKPEKKKEDLPTILKKAGFKALDGGVAGAGAMAFQVCSLMWMRTTMNYQYRFGTSMVVAMRTLWSQGGVVRFYQGLTPALAQGPLSRFGDTAANAGVLALLEPYDIPVGVKTGAASCTAAAWRIFLTPIDTWKTIKQVEGAKGIAILKAKLAAKGPAVMYYGAMANFTATLVGHFPWFFTYNMLDEHLPKPKNNLEKLSRRAFMGFLASAISDSCSNSIRVVKTTKQTCDRIISYPEAIQMVVKADGVVGLFGRGLSTRILTNGIQGLVFSIVWKYLEEILAKSHK